MVLSESQIIRQFRNYGASQCALSHFTSLEKRIASALFGNFNKWIDASGHSDRPPDFYSDKLRMMFDVFTVYDSETNISGRGKKVRNAILEEESRMENTMRSSLRAQGFDADRMNIIYDAEKDGFAYDADHTYANYLKMVNRTVSKHISKLPAYYKNHSGYTCGLFVYDCTETYIEVDHILSMHVEYGNVKSRKTHLPWLDRAFIMPFLAADLRFLVWCMPYKKYSHGVSAGYPYAVITDLRYPKLQQDLIDYTPYLLRPL